MDERTKYHRAIRGNDLIPRTDYPISPRHIDPVRIGDVLGKSETESACRKIVEGLQKRDQGWAPFTLSEIGMSEDFPGLRDLLERGLVIGWEGRKEIEKEDTFMVSHDLISRLFVNAPAWETVSTSGHGD